MNLGRISGEPRLSIHPVPSLGNAFLTYDFKFVFEVCGSGLCRKETTSLGCDYRKLQINNRHLSGCLGTLGLPQHSIVWVSYKQRKLTSYSFGAGIFGRSKIKMPPHPVSDKGEIDRRLCLHCVFMQWKERARGFT